ncbi:MAG: penicillin-binding protein activator, partial [bacterium]|nr:penicillin-binding protein activator [bacterium]
MKGAEKRKDPPNAFPVVFAGLFQRGVSFAAVVASRAREEGPGSWRKIFVAALVLAGLLASCAPVQTYGPQDRSFATAERAFRQGQYADAIRSYQAFLNLGSGDPRVPRALLGVSRSLHAVKDTRGATLHLKRVVGDFPGTGEAEEAQLLLARIAIDEGNENRALSLLRVLTTEARSREVSAKAYLLRGQIFLKRQDPGLAMKQFNRGLGLIRDREAILQFYREVVESLLSSVSDTGLEQFVQDSPSGFPGDVSLFVLGRRAKERQDNYRASVIFDKFRERFPDHPLAADLEKRALALPGSPDNWSNLIIGCVLPLSGPLKDIGKQTMQGVLLSLEKNSNRYGGRGVQVQIEDSSGDPARARELIYRIAQNPNVVAVIGPLTSRAVMESANVAEDYHLPMITPAATAEDIPQRGRYVLRNAMTSASQAIAMSRYAMDELYLRSFAILYPNNRYGTELADVFAREVNYMGGTVVCQIPYERGAVDFGPEILQVIEADPGGRRYSNADLDGSRNARKKLLNSYVPSFDAIYLPGYAEDVGLLVPQLAYYNIDSVQVLGSHNWESMELIRRGEYFVNGAIFTNGFFADSPHTDIAEFVASYRRAYG